MNITQTALIASISLFGALLVFWARDRKRFSSRLESLSTRQLELEAVLSGFMDESERISTQFSRLISADRMAMTAGKNSDAASSRRSAEPSRTKSNGVEKRHLVLSLVQQGRSVAEISERLMIPGGEVELIMNLNQSKRTAVRTA